MNSRQLGTLEAVANQFHGLQPLPSNENGTVMKTCSKCKQELPVNSFGIIRGDKFRASCKACEAKRMNAYRLANPEKYRLQQSKYYTRKKQGKIRVRDRSASAQRDNANKAAWKKSNPEKVAACAARYYERNREKLKERNNLYRKSNPEKIKDAKYDVRWRAKIPDGYVKYLLSKNSQVQSELPRTLIEAKRLHLKIQRLIKEKMHEQ